MNEEDKNKAIVRLNEIKGKLEKQLDTKDKEIKKLKDLLDADVEKSQLCYSVMFQTRFF